jgi:hypothetical protein
MKKCFFIDSQGVKIYYIDFTNLKTVEEIEVVLIESKTLIRSRPHKSMINLANIEGMHFNSQIKELFVDYVKGNADFVQHSAIVGVSGLKRIVFNGIMKMTGRDVRCLDTVEDAKKWLVERYREKSLA